jgi:hypothetical protein
MYQANDLPDVNKTQLQQQILETIHKHSGLLAHRAATTHNTSNKQQQQWVQSM